MSDAPVATIYIAGFAIGTTEDAFQTAFGGYGEISKVLIRGKDKPFAFVTFAEASSADAAVAAGAANIGDAECNVEIQTSKPRAAKAPRNGGDGASIYIKGIPDGEDVKEKLTSIFEGFGEISNVTYKGRDYAFIEFTSTDAVAAAIAGEVSYDDVALTVEERTSAPRKGRVRKERQEETGPNTTIYVKGIPEGTDTDAITDKFGAHGDIAKVTNRSNRGFVFITYADEEGMNTALGANDDWEGDELLIEERKPKSSN